MKRHGESEVSRARWLVRKANGGGEYASKDEFASIFEGEQAGLQRLALLLTADSEAAKRCLIRSFRDCVASISVSREWVVSWSRRVVIRNAISLLMGSERQSFINTNDDAVNKLITFFSGDSPGALAEYESILELPEFERLWSGEASHRTSSMNPQLEGMVATGNVSALGSESLRFVGRVIWREPVGGLE
jgi:hypothetical protein